MKFNRILCLMLCVAMLLCATACRKNPSSLSSNSSDTSSFEEIYQNVEFIEPNNTVTSSKTDTSSQNNTSSTVSDSGSKPTPSQTDDSAKDVLAMLYGFKSIEKVNYYCVKNLPNSDAIYAITEIITDTGTNICDSTSEILCDDKNIKIDQKIITVPYSYLKKHKSVKLTAYHSGMDVKLDFTIKFEDKWDLVFEDDFEGTTIDLNKWNIWDEMRDWRYSYSKDNMILDGNGNLINRMSVLEKPDSATGESQTSGAMTTQGKFETTYGYFEIRMIPHKAEGLMGAFWLMCGDMGDKDAADDGTAKNGCEIDIIETFYHRKDPSHTIHWDGYTHTKSHHFNNSGRDDIFDGNYHTFAFRWSPTEYVFLIDNVVTGKTNEVDICDQPGYLLISSHFNTNAGTLPIGAGEHTDMVVDYVRVYQSPVDTK